MGPVFRPVTGRRTGPARSQHFFRNFFPDVLLRDSTTTPGHATKIVVLPSRRTAPGYCAGMTRLAGALLVGATATLVALSPAAAVAADDPTSGISTDPAAARSGADTAVGVVAGVAALGAGGGLVVAARRRKA